MIRIGSLCTGYGGLDSAVQAVLGGQLAWVADPDPGAAAILTHHHPDTPNLGDITTRDWRQVLAEHGPVDVLTAGFPCQDISNAGRRAGIEGARSGIWSNVADAVRVLRPRLVVLENVAALVVRGLDRVVADLAALGFDTEWGCVRASDVGAPHRRERWFCIAWPAADAGSEGLALGSVQPDRYERAPAERGRGDAAADAARDGRDERRPQPARVEGRSGVASGSRPAPAHPEGGGRGSNPHLGPQPGRRPRPDADGRPLLWGDYAGAIRRWERVLGRPAPAPTEPGRTGQPRLAPRFVEWLMGLDAGHVTAVPGLTRNQMLRALGNGVVPQQAEAALRLLLARATTP